MTTPFWCLFVIALIPYFLAPVSVIFRAKEFGEADNKNPRKQQAVSTGIGARAVAAQQNAWEALPVFAAAVFVGHLSNADVGTTAMFSMVFVAMRVLHAIFYITDIDKARSLTFLGAAVCWIGIFVSAIRN
jgi:uncharacterized MAPEG superfamily protein